MPRKPKGLNKPIAKTAARMSRKAALTPAQLEKLDAYWRASNYLSACQLYLLRFQLGFQRRNFSVLLIQLFFQFLHIVFQGILI